jgi:hypothetical protein
MEQIAINAWRFRLFPSDPMPDFEATYFMNSDGKFSVKSEFFHAEQAPIQWWKYTINSADKKWITFWCGGESFDITEEDQDSIARPFFEKHLMHLLRQES